jgi:aminoglycoside phosphotransferase (APT) family kinase protein
MDTKPARYSIPREFVEEGLRKIYSGSRIDDLISISTGFTNSIFSFTREGTPLIIRMPPRTTPRLAYEAELMKAL